MNLIYFGSPTFSAEILEWLITSPQPSPYQGEGAPSASEVRVVGVVTNPDKKTGRQQILTPSSVAQVAQKYHLPTFKPEKLDNSNLAHLKLLKPDLFLVVAYGKIIPPEYLKIKTLNLHFSLLPKYRGALCLQEALKNGDAKTGVTLMLMDTQIDHGPIITKIEETIDLNDNVATLQTKLTQKAIKLLETSLSADLIGQPQNEAEVSLTPSLKTLNRQSAYLSWDKIKTGDLTTHNLIRSLNPEPGAWTIYNGTEIKLISTTVKNDQLVIIQVQKSGKNIISWQQFCAA